MQKDFDFRIVPPIKRYNTFYKEDVYVVPCRVLNIGSLIKGKTYNIDLEVLDFVKPEIIQTSGITYKGSLKYFGDPPFNTECIIRKHSKSHFTLVVYNKSTIGVIQRLFNVKETLNTEEEINGFYNHNYTELREWLYETNKKKNVENTDLPF